MKLANKQGKQNQIGAFGEQITVNYLKNNGFQVLETNYLKKWGEIDVVARETGVNKHIIRFVEVKTVSYETKADLEQAVAHGTWRPEENVHVGKIQKMNRAIESWLQENKCNLDWQIDIAAVRVVVKDRYATVNYLHNIIL